MKLIYVLPLLLVLSIGISQAEAYDGKMKFTSYEDYPISGDIVDFEGFIYREPPTSDTDIQIIITDMMTEEFILEDSTTVNTTPEFIEEFKQDIWNFYYSVDTSDPRLEAGVRYLVTADYQGVSKGGELFFDPPRSQIIVQAANNVSEPVKQEIPEWVDMIFVSYANKQISQTELLNAIQYLIDMEILTP